LSGSPDVQTLPFDEEELGRMLADAKRRSARLRRRQHRLRSVVTAAATAVVVALAATLATLHSPRPAVGQATQTTRTTQVHVAVPQWRLVGDLSPSWHEVGGLSGDPGLELSCPAAGTCYAADLQLGAGGVSSVEVTADGGKTWTASKLPVPLLGPTHIVCATASTCALLGLSGTVSCGSDLCQVTGTPSSTFEETTDGGVAWTSHPGPAGLRSLIGLGAMACPTASSCVAVESDAYAPDGGASAYVTTDAGQTWKTESMPADFVPRELRCASVTTCFVTGFDQSPGGSETAPGGAVLYTTDAGATWTAASHPSGLGVFGATSCATATDCLGIFSGSDGQSSDVLSSTDGGRSWSSLQASGLPDGVVLGAACPAADQCWAAGLTDAQASANAVSVAAGATGLIASTSDGGHTWQSVPAPAGVKQVASLSCPTTTNCYALAFEQSTGTGKPLFKVVLLSYGS
jgi:photosystem II stability/assembly factor-like uncharacterized protein